MERLKFYGQDMPKRISLRAANNNLSSEGSYSKPHEMAAIKQPVFTAYHESIVLLDKISFDTKAVLFGKQTHTHRFERGSR